jgi:hypothetical protein
LLLFVVVVDDDDDDDDDDDERIVSISGALGGQVAHRPVAIHGEHPAC